MPQSLTLLDERPFFEKALAFGIQNGILDPDKLQSICEEAPKGMVQIARYFGSEFLRPELERARERIVNLVSLNLLSQSDGDLRRAAELLREHSFLSRSKGGADMLKTLIAMPQNTHFGMNEHGGFTPQHIPLLAKWSLRSFADYQAELEKRSRVEQLIDTAIWLADTLGLDQAELEDAGQDAEAVIRTCLLAHACQRSDMLDWAGFEKMLLALRKKWRTQADALPLALPSRLPAPLQAAAEPVRQSVIADLPKILDPKLPVSQLFRQTHGFVGRYFWLEDPLAEVENFERALSATWHKVTGGHTDEGSLLTLFLCLAAQSAPKTLLTEKTATTLVRKLRKNGLHPELATDYIRAHAPSAYQNDYLAMWADFVEEARPTLLSDFDYQLADALGLLRRECNIKAT